jgi:hypothetical protein
MPNRSERDIREALAAIAEHAGPNAFIAQENYNGAFLKKYGCKLKSLKKKDFENYGGKYGLTWGDFDGKLGVHIQRFVNMVLLFIRC